MKRERKRKSEREREREREREEKNPRDDIVCLCNFIKKNIHRFVCPSTT